MIYYRYGRLVKEQSWVPGMGVAFRECRQLYGARCGLEVPCSWAGQMTYVVHRMSRMANAVRDISLSFS